MKRFVKEIMYLMVFASMFLFVACGGGGADTATDEAETTEETTDDATSDEPADDATGDEEATEGDEGEAQTFEAPFINDSSYELTALYISSTETEEWGENLLPENYADEGFQLIFPADGTYDIKIVDDEGQECIVTGIELASGVEFHLTNEDGLFECFGE